MAKKFDDNLFEDIKYVAPEEMDDDLFEDVNISDDMSQLEAAARGAAQGLTFDFGDEIAGAAQAGVGALQGEEGSLKELYQKYRDEQRKQMEQAAEEHPVTYYGSDIAAGVLPALLTGGASAAASVGGSLAKGAAKGSLKTAMKEAAKTGAKFGAATGAGMSKSEITEGDIGGLAKDVASGAAFGGISGAGMPILGKAASKAKQKTGDLLEGAVDLIPGVEAIKLGYKAGKKGIGISQEDMLEEGLRVAKELNKKVSEVLSKSGVERKKAMKLADEAGTRINAGEVIDEVLNDIIEEGAIGLDIKGKEKLVQSVSLLKEGFYDQLQASKLESKLAGQVAKDNALHGAEVETVSSINKNYDELLPIPDAKGTVKGVNAKMSMKTPEGVVEYNKVLTQPLDDTVVKRIEYDAESMMPTELKSVIDYVNGNLVGDLSKPAKNANESKARELAVKLREKLDDAVEEFADPTGTMRNTFRGMEKLGSKQAGIGTEQAVEDNIDSIAKKLLSTGTSSEIDKQRAFQKFRQASPEYSQVIDEAEFISKLNDKLGGMTEGVRTTNVRGLLGTAEGAVAKGSNIAGRAIRNISEKAKPISTIKNKVANRVMDSSDEALTGVSQRMLSSDKKAIQEMGQQLQYALQQEGPIKNALIWSLSQNPLVRKMVNSQEEEVADDLGFEPMTIGTEESNTLEEVDSQYIERSPDSVKEDSNYSQNIDKDLMHRLEGYREKGYIPKSKGEILGRSGVTIANALDLGQRRNLDDLDLDPMIKEKLTPYLGKIKEEADTFLNKNPLDLSGDINNNKIIDAREVANATSSTYYSDVEDNFNRNNKHEKEFSNLPNPVKSVLYSKQFQTGKLGNRLIEAASNDDDYSDVVEVLKGSSNTRRQEEGRYLEQKLEELQKAKDREQKQLGSGATPGTERASLDDLMGKLQGLDINDSDRAEMENAAFNGDMNKLQELMDQYRSMLT